MCMARYTNLKTLGVLQDPLYGRYLEILNIFSLLFALLFFIYLFLNIFIQLHTLHIVYT